MTNPARPPHVAVDEAAPGVLVATLHPGELGLLESPLSDGLRELVLRADRDPEIRAVVITGAHPRRFVSHASIRWLQEGGRDSPAIGPRAAGLFGRLGRAVNRARVLEAVGRRSPLAGILELERFHDTFMRMNAGGVIYVAALNGS